MPKYNDLSPNCSEHKGGGGGSTGNCDADSSYRDELGFKPRDAKTGSHQLAKVLVR